MSAPKGPVSKLRLFKDDQSDLATMSGLTGLTRVDIASSLLHAAIEAIKANEYNLAFPIVLKVDEEESKRRRLAAVASQSSETGTQQSTTGEKAPSSSSTTATATPRSKAKSPRYQQ